MDKALSRVAKSESAKSFRNVSCNCAPLWLLPVLQCFICAFACPPVLAEDAKPDIATPIQPFKTNNELVKSKICQDGQLPWDSDCTWPVVFTTTIKADDGIATVTGKVNDTQKVITSNPALAPCGDQSVKLTESSLSHNFSVGCPSTGDVDEEEFTVQFHAIDCDTTNPDDAMAEGKLTLKCYRCTAGTKKTAVDTNGRTAIPQSAAQTAVDVQFVVLNIDQASNLVDLHVDNPTGWIMSPAIPSQVQLNAGESREFNVNIIVPAGAAAGTVAEFTLTAEIEGTPTSQSTDLVSIAIHGSIIPTISEWGMIVMTFLLLIAGTVVLNRQRTRTCLSGYAVISLILSQTWVPTVWAQDSRKMIPGPRSAGPLQDLTDVRGVILSGTGSRGSAHSDKRILLQNLVLVRDNLDRLVIQKMTGSTELGKFSTTNPVALGREVLGMEDFVGSRIALGADPAVVMTILEIELATTDDGTLYVAYRKLEDDEGNVWERTSSLGDNCLETMEWGCGCDSGFGFCDDDDYPFCSNRECTGFGNCQDVLYFGCVDNGCFDPPGLLTCNYSFDVNQCVCSFLGLSTGSCTIVEDGSCAIATQQDCQDTGGLYGGDGSTCVDIPTLSEWGQIFLILLLLTAGVVLIGRRRAVIG